MWSNLKKTGDMAVGQVGFHNNKAVKKVIKNKFSNFQLFLMKIAHGKKIEVSNFFWNKAKLIVL